MFQQLKSGLLGNAFPDKNNWFRWLECRTVTVLNTIMTGSLTLVAC